MERAELKKWGGRGSSPSTNVSVALRVCPLSKKSGDVQCTEQCIGPALDFGRRYIQIRRGFNRYRRTATRYDTAHQSGITSGATSSCSSAAVPRASSEMESIRERTVLEGNQSRVQYLAWCKGGLQRDADNPMSRAVETLLRHYIALCAKILERLVWAEAEHLQSDGRPNFAPQAMQPQKG